MSTYAIGDIQGCFSALEELLLHIEFDASKDKLWFTGDLVNRGPQSLEVLRFVKSLGDAQVTVLGNHDLTLLAIYYGTRKAHAGDTLNDILQAPDCDDLMAWLRRCPLLHHDHYVMTHAGLAPMWTLAQAKALAHEVEQVLRGENIRDFLAAMYGNQPDRWQDDLTGMDRLRCITNYLTRMRFCDATGHLDLGFKGQIKDKPAELIPWFLVPNRANQHEDIIFGHWAALEGITNTPSVYALDTGCVWGRCLTAMRLEDKQRFFVSCR